MVRAAAGAATLCQPSRSRGDAPLLDPGCRLSRLPRRQMQPGVVPDCRKNSGGVSHLHARLVAATNAVLARRAESLNLLTSRPILQKPTATRTAGIKPGTGDAPDARGGLKNTVRAANGVAQLQAMLNTLSPTATLARGYSIRERLRRPSSPILVRSRQAHS